MSYSNLLPSCSTARQTEIVEACIDSVTQSDAALLLGINPRTLERALARIRDNKAENVQTNGLSGRVHAMIPDMQVTPETPREHLAWIGEYLSEIKPDVIVNIGDFADMEALSSYDVGKKASEGRRVQKDFDVANKAMNELCEPWLSVEDYNPEMHFTFGNHEYRIDRATQNNASLDGFMSMENFNFKDKGWTCHPFLDQVVLDGVSYSHFFANPMTGRPYGGANMDTRLKTIGYSFTMGHQQMYMSGARPLGNGKILRGLVHGAGYLHDEDYKGKQGNTHKRGIIIKHEVFDGDYDLMEVSLDYLCRRYEGMPVSKFMAKKYPDIFHNSVWLQRLESRH